jgi:hypothetical protein
LNNQNVGISLDFRHLRERYYSPFSLEFSKLPKLVGKKRTFFSAVYQEDSPRDYKIIFDPIENRMYPSFDANQYKLTNSDSKFNFTLNRSEDIWIKFRQENKNISSLQKKIMKKQRCFRVLLWFTRVLMALIICILLVLTIYITSTF